MDAIAICSTKKYLHAFSSCTRRAIAASSHLKHAAVIYVSDQSEECRKAAEVFRLRVPDGWLFTHKPIDVGDGGEKYKVKEQILIARMQGAIFEEARRLGVEKLWLIEADILVPSDAFRVLEWALSLPTADGSPYYDVAMITYPNGLFLGGYGDPQHPIAQDFLPHERDLPGGLKHKVERIQEEEKAWVKKRMIPPKSWQAKVRKIMDEVNKCPIYGGSIWAVIAKFGWRRRGWLDFAFPGVGRGAILPTDWIGTGCVMLSKRALAVSTFDGYTGEGTQDLFLVWKRWYPSGLRMTVITHTLCDHVKHEMKDGKHTGKYIHYEASHEQVGEQRGHLRVQQKPWIDI